MNRFKSVLLSAFLTLLTLELFLSPVMALESTGNSTYDRFINDSRFTQGVYWNSNQMPKISPHIGWGCCAYTADFCKYCFGKNHPQEGSRFYNINETRAGDIITIGNPNNGKGHWFVVLRRSGNNLYVAEGNKNSHVRIGWNYTISGNRFSPDSRTFTEGFHFAAAQTDPAPQPPQSDRDKTGAPISGSDQIISDGDYHIVSQIDQTKGVDVYSAFGQDGTNVQLYNNINDYKQVFSVKYIGNSFYTIKHKTSGKYLDVNGADLHWGTNVQIYTPNNTAAQQWVIRPTADNAFVTIQSRCNGLCLDVNEAGNVNGNNIQVWGSNGTAAQHWKFVHWGEYIGQTLTNGTYEIVSAKDTGKCIDVANGITNSGNNVQLYERNNTNAQKWNVKHLGNGYYSITEVVNGKALDLYGGGQCRGTNIQIYNNNNTDSQQWILKKLSNGNFNIICKNSGQYVDCENGQTANGTNIFGWVANGDKNEEWKFVKTTKVPDSVQIFLSADPSAGGKVAGNGIYKYGSMVTVTATPNDGYEFVGWYESGKSARVAGNKSYQFSATSNRILTAKFEKQSTPETEPDVKVSLSDFQEGSKSYNDFNVQAKWSVTPSYVTVKRVYFEVSKDDQKKQYDATYSGSNLYKTTVPVSDFGGKARNYSVNTVAELSNGDAYISTNAITIKVLQNPYEEEFKVQLVGEPAAGGVLSGAGTYKYGTSVTVRVSPGIGYDFQGWYIDNKLVSANSSYTFTVKANMTIKARFTSKIMSEDSEPPVDVGDDPIPEPEPIPNPEPNPEPELNEPTVRYQTHVENIGWQDYVYNGASSGTSGMSLRLEGIYIDVPNNSNLGLEYRTHVENIGWQNYVRTNQMAGTQGMALRLEAIQIRLTGVDKDKYDVYYRVHAQDVGWMNWAKNDQQAGTAGFARRLEAIQIRILPKGQIPSVPEDTPNSTDQAFLQR